MIFQEPILDAPMEVSIQESMIQELAIQVSVIQESKMQAPTILMVLESNEVLRIKEYSKVQRTNETLKIEEPLKVQEFKQSFKIYKEETSMCIGPLVKEKCMNMVIKMSLTLHLFRWKILCKDIFPYFPVFGSIRKNESKENYL